MEEIRVGTEVMVKAIITEIIIDKNGRCYKVVINGDNLNANRIRRDDFSIIV